jgi:hypothetical protein
MESHMNADQWLEALRALTLSGAIYLAIKTDLRWLHTARREDRETLKQHDNRIRKLERIN